MNKSSNNVYRKKEARKQEVLDLIHCGNYTPNEIRSRAKIGKSYFFKIVKELRQEGWDFDLKKNCRQKIGVVNTIVEKKTWRYHALQFEIKPYYFMPRYAKNRKLYGNYSIPYSNWKIILYSKKIIMFLKAGHDFEHSNKDTAMMNATEDFNRRLRDIGSKFGFEVFKNQKANIRLVKHHLAYTNAPEFDVITQEKTFITFRGKDNKIFLQYDRSKGINEREYPHIDLEEHSDKIEKHFKDMIENDPLTNSELMTVLKKQMSINIQTQKQLSTAVELVKVNTITIQTLSKGLEVLVPKPLEVNESNLEKLPNYIG